MIFWTSESKKDRWESIGHVGVYIGDGNIIDASSSKDEVVKRKIWEGNGFALKYYARPDWDALAD